MQFLQSIVFELFFVNPGKNCVSKLREKEGETHLRQSCIREIELLT